MHRARLWALHTLLLPLLALSAPKGGSQKRSRDPDYRPHTAIARSPMNPPPPRRPRVDADLSSSPASPTSSSASPSLHKQTAPRQSVSLISTGGAGASHHAASPPGTAPTSSGPASAPVQPSISEQVKLRRQRGRSVAPVTPGPSVPNRPAQHAQPLQAPLSPPTQPSSQQHDHEPDLFLFPDHNEHPTSGPQLRNVRALPAEPHPSGAHQNTPQTHMHFPPMAPPSNRGVVLGIPVSAPHAGTAVHPMRHGPGQALVPIDLTRSPSPPPPPSNLPLNDPQTHKALKLVGKNITKHRAQLKSKYELTPEQHQYLGLVRHSRAARNPSNAHALAALARGHLDESKRLKRTQKNLHSALYGSEVKMRPKEIPGQYSALVPSALDVVDHKHGERIYRSAEARIGRTTPLKSLAVDHGILENRWEGAKAKQRARQETAKLEAGAVRGAGDGRIGVDYIPLAKAPDSVVESAASKEQGTAWPAVSRDGRFRRL